MKRSDSLSFSSASKIDDLVIFLENEEEWTVDHIRLQLTLSDLSSLLSSGFGGDGTTSQLRIRLQSLAGRSLSSRRRSNQE
jgi:hypothetical protein